MVRFVTACLLCVAVLKLETRANNITDKFVTMEMEDLRNEYRNSKFDSYPERQSRFFTFDSKNGDVDLALEFNVPFVKIPVKKVVDNMKRGLPLANINLAALGLTAAVVFVTLFAVPLFTGLFAFGFPSYVTRDEDSSMMRMINNVDQALMDNNINTTTCMQRAVCWLVKSSSNNVSAGSAQSYHKIIDGIASNSWIQSMMSGSSIQIAAASGYDGENCSSIYSECKLSQSSIMNLVKRFISIMKTKSK